MATLYNRAAVATATTGTGTVTLGAALSDAFCTFAEAGVSDADVVSYLITEGADFECGRGTYTASGTTLSRDTVLLSKISGTAGTTKMTLAGSAEVRIAAAAEDIRDRFRVLAASAAASSHTGDTTETTLATVTVPAGAMGANGILRITTVWSFSNTADGKTLKARFGGISGTSFIDRTLTTHQTYRDGREIKNRNATNSQMGFTQATGGWHVGNAALITSSLDTTASQDLVFTGKLAASADTVTLESYIVEILYQA